MSREKPSGIQRRWAAGVTLLGAAAQPIAARQPVARPTPYRLRIQTSPRAGFQYRAGEKLWRRPYVGKTLALVRKPDTFRRDHSVRYINDLFTTQNQPMEGDL